MAVGPVVKLKLPGRGTAVMLVLLFASAVLELELLAAAALELLAAWVVLDLELLAVAAIPVRGLLVPMIDLGSGPPGF